MRQIEKKEIKGTYSMQFAFSGKSLLQPVALEDFMGLWQTV